MIFWMRGELRSSASDAPALPEKRFLDNDARLTLNTLTNALEHFLATVATHSILHNSDAFRAFMSSNFLSERAIYYSKIAGEVYTAQTMRMMH